MQESMETACESLGALRRLDRIAKRHLFEREEHAVAGALLDPHRALGGLREFPRTHEALEFALAERRIPALVRLHLVVALPLQIRSVAKTTGKLPQEFAAATLCSSGTGLCNGRSDLRFHRDSTAVNRFGAPAV
jgi:hypothetical protein